MGSDEMASEVFKPVLAHTLTLTSWPSLPCDDRDLMSASQLMCSEWAPIGHCALTDWSAWQVLVWHQRNLM